MRNPKNYKPPAVISSLVHLLAFPATSSAAAAAANAEEEPEERKAANQRQTGNDERRSRQLASEEMRSKAFRVGGQIMPIQLRPDVPENAAD